MTNKENFIKIFFNFWKNSDTISRLSFDIFPNTSSKTTMFGLGKVHTLLSTDRNANDAIVLSYPDPETINFSNTSTIINH
mgnify:CR=1 FL=1